jgi:hypothetical protein
MAVGDGQATEVLAERRHQGLRQPPQVEHADGIGGWVVGA